MIYINITNVNMLELYSIAEVNASINDKKLGKYDFLEYSTDKHDKNSA